jgi:dolichol kinase
VTAPRALSLGAEAARKAIHLATAVLPIAWAYDLIATRDIQWLLGAAVVIALLVEFARYRRGAFGALFQRTFGGLLRTHEQRTIAGATWLAIGMWGVVMLAPRYAAIAALWAAAVGDAVAALAGRAVQQWRGARASAATIPSGKTLVGAVAGAAATAVGVMWLTPATLALAAVLGAVAALAEWPARPGDDNVRVVAAVAVAAALVGLR